MLGAKLRAQEHTVAMPMLRQDHDLIKSLFERFGRARSLAEKKSVTAAVIRELKIHTAVEEQIFYPAVRRQILDPEGLMDKADEEHHEIKVLVAELELMKGTEPHFAAKFAVLAENVRHHIKDEERYLFPKAAKTRIDFEILGERMAELKRYLRVHGVPGGPETAMVQKAGVVRESPARMALKTIDVPQRPHGQAKRHHTR